MKTNFIIATCLILGLFIAINPDLAQTEAKRGDLLIIYSGNTLGELKPCGCAKEEDQGGIERRMAYLKTVRASTKNTLLVDTGDGFKAPTKQGKLKAEYLMKSMVSMNYDAVTLGDKDAVYGNKFIEELKTIPWVSSNIELKGTSFHKYIIKNYEDGLKIAIITAADPGLFYTKHSSDIKVYNPIEVVNKIIDELEKKENPHLIVLLSHMKKEDGIKLLDIEGVDIVINGHIEDAEDIIDMKPIFKDGKAFVQPGPRGQKMGELKVTFNPDGEISFVHQMVKLDSHVNFDPEMVELYEKYNQKIEALFFASLADKRKSKKSKVFATDVTCAGCHPSEHKIWSESRHGRAYRTLVKVNKSFDPECLICHTVGFDKPGGFVSEIDTPKLKNVQCEVCHGSGTKHVESPQPDFGKQAKDACKMCHVKNHSPKFNFNDYWPRIKH